MRTDRSAPEESTSITTGTSDRYRLPCSMAFIVASATAVLSLSRRCSERPNPFTTAATLSIANLSFPGSLDTFNFARTRQVPLRPFCSTHLGTVTILPRSLKRHQRSCCPPAPRHLRRSDSVGHMRLAFCQLMSLSHTCRSTYRNEPFVNHS